MRKSQRIYERLEEDEVRDFFQAIEDLNVLEILEDRLNPPSENRLFNPDARPLFLTEDQEPEDTNMKDLVLCLAGLAVGPIINDETWQCFDFKKRPKIRSFWKKLFPQKYVLYNFIIKDVLTMSLIDIVNGIKNSNKSTDVKLLLSLAVFDKILSCTEHMFSLSSFMDIFISLYNEYASFDDIKSLFKGWYLIQYLAADAEHSLTPRQNSNHRFGLGMLNMNNKIGVNSIDIIINCQMITELIDGTNMANSLKKDMFIEKYIKYQDYIKYHNFFESTFKSGNS